MADPVQLVTAGEFIAQDVGKGFTRVPTPNVDTSAQWASSIALGYIKKRKVLPLLEWGTDVRSVVARLMAYDLSANRGFAPQSGNNANIRERYEDALKWLIDVSKGTTELVDCKDSSTTPEVDQASPLMASDAIVNWSYQTRFGRTCRRTDGLG